MRSTSRRSGWPVRGSVTPRCYDAGRLPEGPAHSMSTILVTGASGFVGSHVVPALLAAGHRVVALAHTPEAGKTVLARLPAAGPALVEVRVGDVTRPETLGAGARRRRRRRPPRRPPAGPRRRCRSCASSTPRAPAPSSPRWARPACDGSSTWARWASPTTRTSTTRAPRPGPRRSSRASGLDWTILKPSLQFGPGDGFFNLIAHLVRISPGVVPVPGNGKARFQPIHVDDVARIVVASLADPTTVGGVVRARRAALLDVSRDHRRGRLRARQAARDRADAGRAHPPGRGHERARAPALPGRHRPAAPAQARQHRPARAHPGTVRLRAAADGGRPRLPPDASSATRSRHGREPCSRRRRPGSSGWCSSWSSPSGRRASSAPWIARQANPAAESDLTAAGDAEVIPQLDATATDLSALADQVDALSTQARGALAALNGSDTADRGRRPSPTATR